MKPLLRRLLSFALVCVMFFSTLTPVLAAYEVPEEGDQAWISVSTRLKRSDNGNVYYLYSSGNHELRYFHFREAGYGGTKNYDPNTVMYCVEMGVSLPDNPKYTAGYASEHSFWTNLSDTAKTGMLLAIGFGYPHSSLSELDAPSRDDAIAATQTIVWEFYRGYRTSLEGMPSDTYLYNGYIKNTPAYDAYWNILEMANDYYEDSRFDLDALTDNDRFIVWTRSNAQTMMTFTIPDDATLAGPPQFKPTGRIEIYKKDLSGTPLSGAGFTAKNQSTGKLYEIGPTNNNGYTISEYLPFGTYTVTESNFPDGYTSAGASSWTVTLDKDTPHGTVTINAVNRLIGGTLEVTKTTNTGKDLKGWEFGLFRVDILTGKGKLVSYIETDENGKAVVEDLPAGQYYLYEYPRQDDYWSCDAERKDVLIHNGQTTSVSFHNIHGGRVEIFKKTNTGKNLANWEFGVFSDEECTSQITTITSSSTGFCETVLPEGTYWVKETGGPGYNSEYWDCDTEPQRVEVKLDEDVRLNFTNKHCGKLQIQKDLTTDGPLEGWKYQITRLNDDADLGILTSGADGTVLSDKLVPGDYLIEEIFEENSPYYCKSENPVLVSVNEGQTATVKFTNALRPGKIEIEKLNFSGEHLAGAKFLLEWSEDGQTWQPVTYSDKEDVVKGACGSEALDDGALITDETGVISFENLYPLVQYRVTELEAPEGYVLLSDYAYLGELPTDSLTVSLVVHNAHGYVLPATGVDQPGSLVGFGTALAVLALAIAATFTFAYFKPVYNGKNAIKK